MIYTNTKYWSFTWDTNVKQKKLPPVENLQRILEQFSDYYIFQLEEGSKKKKRHYQGCFTLTGPRKSKIKTLELIKESIKNVSGLTLSPVYDKVAITTYVTKSEGRISGPYYGGKKEMFNSEESNLKLRPWQLELYKMLTGDKVDLYKDRKILWIQNPAGGAGKSRFMKWLRMGQKSLIARALPISSVDRLISAVCLLNQQIRVDLYMIDFTRTKGKDQSYEDLFASLEQIKNGYLVDVMYGKYNEAVFQPPMIVIFTNEDINSYAHYLSQDRWIVKEIQGDKLVDPYLALGNESWQEKQTKK